MKKCDFVLSGGGINWCWYTGYDWQADGTAREVWSDRFHRFNPDQGADDHPDADGTLVHSLAKPVANPRVPDDWNERQEVSWRKTCADAGVSVDFDGYIITMTTKDGTRKKVVVLRN